MKRHISEVSLERAQNSIITKLKILEDWLLEGQQLPWLCDDQGIPIRDSHGEMQLDFYPNNVSSFCAWNSSQNCGYVQAALPKITGTNRGTLDGKKYGQLKIAVENTCAAISAKAISQLLQANKANRIKQLEAEVRSWKELCQKQATDIAQLRDRQVTTETSLQKKERALANAAEEHNRIVNELEAKIAELTLGISKFTLLKVQSRK